MATQKKKHLIDLMIEAGVKWPEGAEFAAQDKLNLWLYFFKMKPSIRPGDEYYSAKLGPIGNPHLLPSLCRNWHQTIVTREQYVEALALAANVVKPAMDAVEWHNPPSIEQLTSDYHAKAAEADRLQAVADEALKAADEALLALEKAGELIGLVISIDTKTKHAEQQEQPVITDWRDLRVGDVVEYVSGTTPSFEGKECVVIAIDPDEETIYHLLVDYNNNHKWCGEFKFIRRQ